MTLRTTDREGHAEFDGYRTWFRITGDVAADGRTVVHYDQLGHGRSTHLPDKAGDGDFWTVDLFVRELANLIGHLGLSDYHVLGPCTSPHFGRGKRRDYWADDSATSSTS